MKKAILWALVAAFATAWAIGHRSTAQERAEPTAVEAEQRPGNDVRIAHAEAMVESAEKAYESNVAEYELGKRLMENVYNWSRRWLEAELIWIHAQWSGDELRVNANRTEAFRKHLARMEQLHAKVTELHKVQAFGGEASTSLPCNFSSPRPSSGRPAADCPSNSADHS